MRDLVGTVKREGAAVGVFVTLNKPSKPMEREAVMAGFYDSPMWARKFRRIQIVTAHDLIEGRMPDLPPTTKSGMREATRVAAPEAPSVPMFDEADLGE